MNKSIYEKWDELINSTCNSEKMMLAEYYLSSTVLAKLYFGKDKNNQYIFVEFSKQYLQDVDLPEFNGLDMVLCDEPSIDINKRYIKIKNNSNNEALFFALSSSLYENLLDTTDYHSAYIVLVKTLKDYKEFFTNPNYKLSFQEEQGLCAELLQVKDLIMHKGVNSIFCWQGPRRNKRDFVFETAALEIKSTISQVESSIHVSSENQLDCNYPESLSSLFLRVFVLEKDDKGFNIISCAKDVLDLLSSNKEKNYFISNLLKNKVNIGIFKPRYSFTIQARKQYKIDNSFPCINNQLLPDGVYNVEYRLRLNSIKKFQISEEELYDGLQ